MDPIHRRSLFAMSPSAIALHRFALSFGKIQMRPSSAVLGIAQTARRVCSEIYATTFSRPFWLSRETQVKGFDMRAGRRKENANSGEHRHDNDFTK